jgi:hypothetical protein
VINGDFSSHPDLCDQPLAQPDLQLFTDRSSFLKEGTRYGGYAVVTLDSILEGQTLVLGTSAQKAGLIDLTLALQPAVGRTVNIYTDCKDAFTSLHVHGSIYKERGLITLGGKDIKYGLEILKLLKAVWIPPKVSCYALSRASKGQDSSSIGKLESKSGSSYGSSPGSTCPVHSCNSCTYSDPIGRMCSSLHHHKCEWFTQEEEKY